MEPFILKNSIITDNPKLTHEELKLAIENRESIYVRATNRIYPAIFVSNFSYTFVASAMENESLFRVINITKHKDITIRPFIQIGRAHV